MQKRILVLITILIFIVFGCKETEFNDQLVETIQIVDGMDQNINMSTIVDSIWYVRLETTYDNIIGEVTNLFPLKDRMLIFDNLTHSIFMFDYQGNFLSKISKRGAGPEEYIKIRSVAIDDKEKRIFILDSRNRILIYTFEGGYISSLRLDLFFSDMKYLGNDVLICYCDYAANEDNMMKDGQTPVWVLYDLKDKSKKGFFYEDVTIQSSEVTDIHMISPVTLGTEYLLTCALNDYVWNANEKNVQKAYYIDFGKKECESKRLYIQRLKTENVTPESILYGNACPDFYQLNGVMAGTNFMFIGYSNYKTNRIGVLFYDMVNKTYLSGRSSDGWPIKNDIDGGFPLIPHAIVGDRIYTLVDIDYLDYKKITNPVLLQYMKTMSSDDNPIIMISKTKYK